MFRFRNALKLSVFFKGSVSGFVHLLLFFKYMPFTNDFKFFILVFISASLNKVYVKSQEC